MIGPNCTVCQGVATFKEVNKEIVYHIDTIPFKTTKRYRHFICTMCNETYIDPELHNVIAKDMENGKNFLAAQDRMYGNKLEHLESIKCRNCGTFNNFHNGQHGYCTKCKHSLPMFMDSTDYQPVNSGRSWWNVRITYLKHIEEVTRAIPASEDMMIFATKENAIAYGMKQFSMPKNGIKIIGVKFYAL